MCTTADLWGVRSNLQSRRLRGGDTATPRTLFVFPKHYTPGFHYHPERVFPTNKQYWNLRHVCTYVRRRSPPRRTYTDQQLSRDTSKPPLRTMRSCRDVSFLSCHLPVPPPTLVSILVSRNKAHTNSRCKSPAPGNADWPIDSSPHV